ncbi:hypothetical protein VTL71DRAFT_4369 [Oculimacula yallundae]|uniref:Uncharacterized protein n=1 Tax=Oculimacula yallundae TaxID=86028 RepID=A0ABR4C1W2_9HELO
MNTKLLGKKTELIFYRRDEESRILIYQKKEKNTAFGKAMPQKARSYQCWKYVPPFNAYKILLTFDYITNINQGSKVPRTTFFLSVILIERSASYFRILTHSLTHSHQIYSFLYQTSVPNESLDGKF